VSNLTPTGGAAGGQGPQSNGPPVNKALTIAGLVVLAAGGSWGFYYFLKPPQD
jgi:hypothetical protein